MLATGAAPEETRLASEVQIALQPTAGQDPAAAIAAAATRLVRLSMDMLVQQVGQSMAGKVLAAPPNFPAGLAQIAVADQVLTLKLSSPLPVGTAVRIDVQPSTAGNSPTIQVQPQPSGPIPQPLAGPIRAPLLVAPALAAPQSPNPPAPMGAPPAPLQAAGPAALPSAPPPTPLPTAPPAPTQRAVARPLQAPAQAQTPAPAAQPTALASPSPAVAAQPAPAHTPAAPSSAAPAATAPVAPAPVAAAVAPVPAGLPHAEGPDSVPPQTVPAGGPGPTLLPVSPPPTQAAPPLLPSSPRPSATTVAPPSVLPLAVADPIDPPVAPQRVAQTTPQSPASAPIAAPPLPAAPQQHQLLQRLTQAFSPPTPVPAAPASGSAAQLVSAATTQAAAQQQSQAPLLQALAVRLPQLPPAVAEAAARLLAGRVNLDRGAPTAETLKQAVLRSGVFLDAPLKPGTPPDTRQALQQLRTALFGWLGADVEPVPSVERRPPPPARGDVPRAQPPELPPATEGSAREAGRSLLGQVEGALSRLKLLQLTSQTTDASRPAGAIAAPMEWNLEVPMMIGRELTLAQIQISREDKSKAEAREKNWRLRFALNFSVLGEVGAQVAMVGSKTSVALWADDAVTADALEDMLPELAPAFAARGLDLVALSVRRSAPRDEVRPAGRLMDSLR